MAVEKKPLIPLPAFVRNRWGDPVWSKVIAGIFLTIGGSVWLWIKSITQNITFAQAFHQCLRFLTQSTPINNGLLCLAGSVLVWLLFQALLRRRSTSKAELPAAATSISTNVPFLADEAPPVIERFGFHSTDIPLLLAFQAKNGNPITHSLIDGHYGEVMEFDVNMGPDDLDCMVKLASSRAEHVSYTYIPTNGFIFYLRVKVRTSNNKQISGRWIALRLGISAVSGGINQGEKAYPSIWKPVIGDWVVSTYHIPTLVAETFGPEGWTYHSLEGFRLRGKGKLESITLS